MFFLDSYAIIEMAKGNPNYRPFRDEASITSRSNLLEVYYILTQLDEEPLAKACLATLGPSAVDLQLELIPTIARLRLRQRGATGRRFSYSDASGYVYARENGYSFLTGAHEFEGLPDVTFVR